MQIVTPSWLVPLALLLLAAWGMTRLQNVLSPIFFAFLIAYLFDPLVDRFEKRNVPRGVAIGLILGLSGLVLVLITLIGIPVIGKELAYFARTVPDKLNAVWKDLDPWLRAQGIAAPASFSDAISSLNLDAQAAAKQFAAPLKGVLAWLLGGAANAIGAIFGALMIPVIAFYLLYDFDRIIAASREFLPHQHRAAITSFVREVDTCLGQFIRGQLIVMLLLALLYCVGYAVIGVPMALVIGVIAGLLSFIPYVGGAVALILALGMSALHWTGWGQLLGVVAVYTVIQLLEGFVITPKIVGDKVGLSSLWVIIALMVGGDLFGFLGILLAVPAAAAIKIALRLVIAKYRESKFFLGENEETRESSALPRGLL